jgi:putative PIN family toxin of toxin-antitoxin system
VIVFDVSSVVGAVIKRDRVPERALRHAATIDRIARSAPVMAELLDVLARPKLQRFVDPDLRDEVLSLLDRSGVVFTPTAAVTDCRDPADDKVLELALAASADVIISSDADLLVLDPWRGIPILTPAAYLVKVTDDA